MTVKQIHIEKYDIGTFEKEQKPYAMILTDVIQRMPIQHSQAFLLWSYLESLPATWKPCKHQLTKHFGIGDRTYERHIAWLNAVGLIEYRQNRQSDGSFGKGRLVVLNGTQFNPDAVSTRSAKIGGTVVNRLTKAQVVQLHRSAKLPLNGEAVERSNDAHINTTTTHINNVKKKTNNKELSVSVFSCTDSVKAHLSLTIANRKAYVEEEVINQGIYYAFETNEDRSFDSVNKKLNIFLKMVREGKWLIPQGFQGITSQSIREKEEREQESKRLQYQEEAHAAKNIFNAVSQGQGFKGFSDMFKKLKEDVNGKEDDGGAMQKQAL